MERMKKAYKGVEQSAQNGIKKVQGKSWAGPLGRALSVTGKIVGGCGEIVPGLKIAGNALELGATLLNPDTSEEDMKAYREELRNVANDNLRLKNMILAKIDELQAQEVRKDQSLIQTEMLNVLKNIQEENPRTAKVVDDIKSVVDLTLDMVTDLRYRVSFLCLESRGLIIFGSGWY